MEDFEVGAYVGRRRAGSIGEGDLVRVIHRATGDTLAMKRVEVDPDPGRAQEVLCDLTRSARLSPHSSWIGLHVDRSFLQEYVDNLNCPRARVCIVEELADHNLESEIVSRAVDNRPFEELFATFAELVHGVQALHFQGCLHRDICPRNVLFTAGRIRLGTPGPASMPPAAGYYPRGACEAYSADIFALGLVLLEMAMLHPLDDMAATGVMVLEEIMALDGSETAFRSWLDERCSLLGLALLGDDIAEVLAAMLTSPAEARPTADDLLDMPAFAPYADPFQVLPVTSRPCVVMAHQLVASCRSRDATVRQDVPRRCLLTLPWFHQVFSKEGSERAMRDGKYRWCGRDYELWWLEADSLPLRDAVEGRGDAGGEVGDSTLSPPRPLGAEAENPLVGAGSVDEVASLVASAEAHRSARRLVAAELCYRAALRGLASPQHAGSGSTTPPSAGNSAMSPEACWQGFAATLIERGNFSAARLAFQLARRGGGCMQIALTAAPSSPEMVSPGGSQLWGLCELFMAVETLCEHSSGATPREAGLRAAHVALYYRSALAAEAGDWEVFAALGEFYRLVGCPDLPFRAPAPNVATSVSYFEQARGIRPTAPFLEERLARLAAAPTPAAA